MEIFERISKIAQNIDSIIPEKLDEVKRIPLIRIPIADTNFLGISLTVAPPKSDSTKSFFITFHTVRPKNRINLKKFNMVDEMYCLLNNILNLKYTGWKEFFLKNFKSLDIKNKLSKISLSHLVFDIEEDLEWNKTNIDLQQLENVVFEDIEVKDNLKFAGLESITCEEIEKTLSEYLKEEKWEHFIPLYTNNLCLALSVTKYGGYTFGITTGNPKNYIKFKNYDYITQAINLIKVFKYLLERYPNVKNYIISNLMNNS
jgi:hypothetical protein